jgi:ATP-binding cassette subfamily E protein 1
MAASNKDDRLTRISVIDIDRCKPNKCGQECRKACPVNHSKSNGGGSQKCLTIVARGGNLAAGVSTLVALIDETLCIGCGLCVRACPFAAISIVNVPKELSTQTIHRFGANSFKLHRLPMPRPGQVLGLVGSNGIGKSTALKIMAGKLQPNLGRVVDPPGWKEILSGFRGSDLQSLFTNLLEGTARALVKPQEVEALSRLLTGNVGTLLTLMNNGTAATGSSSSSSTTATAAATAAATARLSYVIDELDLTPILERSVSALSGGELQRFAIALACIQDASMYVTHHQLHYSYEQ